MRESDVSGHSAQIQGVAVFAGLGFSAGFGLIFALERVGAPDALVTALGPLLALATLGVIAAATRAPNITDFLAVRRAAPAAYAGLAFAAVALGLLACLAGGVAEGRPPPWRGAIGGIVAAALFAGPRWRFENASASSDVLASYYPSAAARALLALAVAAAGVAIGVAGLGLGARTLQGALGIGLAPAVALSALSLAVSLATGGAKSALWSDAASGGGALLLLALAAALAVHDPADPAARLAAFYAAAAAAPGPGLAADMAAGVATATLLASAPSALAVASPREALRAGLFGLVFTAIGAALYAVGADAGLGRPSQRALAATLTWLPALALARAGALAVARAWGLDLASARAKLAVLASRRIAAIRAAGLAATALCAAIVMREGASGDRALYVGLAIGLAFVAPSLAATLIPGRADRSALSALAAAAAFAALHALVFGAPADGDAWLEAGLAAAGLGGVAALGAILSAGPAAPRRVVRSDPFLDSPLDAAAAPVSSAAPRGPDDEAAHRPLQ